MLGLAVGTGVAFCAVIHPAEQPWDWQLPQLSHQLCLEAALGWRSETERVSCSHCPSWGGQGITAARWPSSAGSNCTVTAPCSYLGPRCHGCRWELEPKCSWRFGLFCQVWFSWLCLIWLHPQALSSLSAACHPRGNHSSVMTEVFSYE